MDAVLIVNGPGNWAMQHVLRAGTETRVGRASSNDLTINDPLVSSRHALLAQRDGNWTVRDLQSRNGTFLNGEPVAEAFLSENDMIRVGRTELVFQSEGSGGDSRWEDTSYRLREEESRIRLAIERGRPEEADIASSRDFPPSGKRNDDTEKVVLEGGEGFGAQSSSFAHLDVAEPLEITLEPSDHLWVAETMANVLGDIATQKGLRQDLYRYVLELLREAIEAENGFLMIPDRASKRWIIEAWVGNSANWSSYEKERPVPLTIANTAFKEGRIFSSLFPDMGQMLEKSDSMRGLQVMSYVAVPLRRHGRKGGLVYFDTRRAGARRFAVRDIKLLERIGSYILEIDNSVR